MINGFWSVVAFMALVALTLMALSGYLAGQVDINLAPLLDLLKGR